MSKPAGTRWPVARVCVCGRGARDARVRFTDEEEPDGVFCEARAVREGSRVRVCVVARRPERDLQKPQRGRGRKSRDKAKSARFQPISWFFSGFARSSSLCNHLLFSQSQSGHRSGFTFVKGRRRLALRLGFEFSRNYLPLRAEHRNSLHVCHRSDLIDHLSFVSESGEAGGDSASTSEVEGWILFGLVVGISFSKQTLATPG